LGYGLEDVTDALITLDRTHKRGVACVVIWSRPR
jgi:hypothetical protein